METLAIVKEVAIIVLLASASILCVLVIVGLAQLFPHLRRFADNLAGITASTAKIAGDLASVSADVADDIRKTTAATAETAENMAKTSKNIFDSSAYIRTALQLLELLGPAGRAANYANMGISKIPNLLRSILRRG